MRRTIPAKCSALGRLAVYLACGAGGLFHGPQAVGQAATASSPEGETAALAAPPLDSPQSGTDPFEASHRRVRDLQRPVGMEWLRTPEAKDARPSSSLFSQTVDQQLRSEDSMDRLRAAEASALLDPAGALERLVPLLSDPDEEVRLAAAEQAIRTDSDALLERLLAMMGETPPSDDLLEILPCFEPYLGGKALDVFTAADLPPARRMASARLLGYMGARCATEALAREAQSGEGEWALVCARSLEELGDPAALKFWINLLPHSEFEIGATAAEALGRLGGGPAFEALRNVVLSPAPPSEKLRARAAQALVHWPPGDAGPVLVVLMESNPAFADVAFQSLRELTGRDFGAQPKDWREWFEAGMPPERKEAETAGAAAL